MFRIEKTMRGENSATWTPASSTSNATDEVSRHEELLAEVRALRKEVARMHDGDIEIVKEVKQEVNAEVIADYKQQVIEANKLKNDLQGLSDAIEATKIEIASLGADNEANDKIHVAGIELSAVVSDTEVATDGIIEAAETIETLSDRLKAEINVDSQIEVLDEIAEQVVKVFEACNFQDITGQRITKVVNTMNFIDERIHGMMEIWGGKDLFADLIPEAKVEHPDDELLNGPALPEAQISQADIDALFD